MKFKYRFGHCKGKNGDSMTFRKTVILICSLLIFAMFILPEALAENSCLDCHEKLTVFNETEKLFNDIRVKHMTRDVSCSVECHANTLDKIAKSNYEQWTKSKHALLGVTCDKCHGGDAGSGVKETAHTGIYRSSDARSSVYYRNVPETCGKCHADELKNFKNSAHFQKLEALKQAPTCNTCHVSHEFNILDIKEFHGLCNNCHNSEMRIAPSDAPDKAILALQNADKLKSEIKKAQDAITQAKKEGLDVSVARDELSKAESIRDNLPVIWHSFDLPSFEKLITDGLNAARQSQKEAGMQTAEAPSTPGFGIILSLAGFSIIYVSIIYSRRK